MTGLAGSEPPLLAGIEGRGTEFHCVLGTGPEDIRAGAAFPVTTPEATLAAVTRFVRAAQPELGPVAAVGIACFGPLDLRPDSPGFGRLTSPLAPAWQGFDLVGAVRRELPVPVVLDTDVNAAAVAERAAGAGRGRDQLAFVTIGTGTGIGAGVLVDGRPVHGRTHPEVGHLPVARHPSDRLPGHCPHHRDCLEGLAKSAALAERWQLPVTELGSLPEQAIRLAAWYLAQLVTALTYLFSPQLVVVDGAVPALPGMLAALREETVARLGGDPAVGWITGAIDSYLVRSGLAGPPGALGALALARQLVDEVHDSKLP
jgi:fructokinase